MGKVSIVCLLVSTTVALYSFGHGVGLLRAGEAVAYLQWALVTLICVLVANAIAIVHAAQSDRLIRDLRQQVDDAAAAQPGDGLKIGPQL